MENKYSVSLILTKKIEKEDKIFLEITNVHQIISAHSEQEALGFVIADNESKLSGANISGHSEIKI